MGHQLIMADSRRQLFLIVFVIGCYLLLFQDPALAAPTESSKADSMAVVDSTINLRGVEREEQYAGDTWRSVWNVIFFLPRKTLNAILYSTGRGAYLATDPKVVARVEEFLYFYDRRLGWHPVLNLDSDFSPEYGAAMFYRNSRLGTVIKGKYSGSRNWKGKAQATLHTANDDRGWKTSLTGELTEDDDFVFSGIGANPRSDPRSHFRPDTDLDRAIFFQRREKLQFSWSLYTDSPWEYFFTSLYQQREVSSLADGEDQFDLVFETQLPGGEPDEKWRSVEAELGARYDTRKYQRTSLGGISLAGYLGYSGSVSAGNRLFRSGVDLAAYFPVLKRNRLIVPRLVFKVVENLNPSEPIPFFDYPRHPKFRGVSSRKLLRQDNLSFIPALEYRWPLAHKLSGFLFSEALIVSKTLAELTLDHAPWAVGCGMRLHSGHLERGRVQFAYGSEGLRIVLSFGSGGPKNVPSEWR